MSDSVRFVVNQRVAINETEVPTVATTIEVETTAGELMTTTTIPNTPTSVSMNYSYILLNSHVTEIYRTHA